MPAKIRVLVVDDHRLFAEALKMLLAGEEDLEIEGVVGTGKEAVEMVGRTHPGVVLMDMELPGMGGIEATRRIRELSPDTQVVVITAYQEPAQIAEAVSAGACGFLPKTEAADELLGVVRRAAAGEIVLHKIFRPVLRKVQAAEQPPSNGRYLVNLLTS